MVVYRFFLGVSCLGLAGYACYHAGKTQNRVADVVCCTGLSAHCVGTASAAMRLSAAPEKEASRNGGFVCKIKNAMVDCDYHGIFAQYSLRMVAGKPRLTALLGLFLFDRLNLLPYGNGYRQCFPLAVDVQGQDIPNIGFAYHAHQFC